MNELRGRLFYFVVGGLAGVGAGILLAPGAGKATRASLRRRLRETSDFVDEWTDRIVRKGEEVGVDVGHRLSHVGSSLAERMERQIALQQKPGLHDRPVASA